MVMIAWSKNSSSGRDEPCIETLKVPELPGCS
jgi:hypothetical protein